MRPMMGSRSANRKSWLWCVPASLVLCAPAHAYTTFGNGFASKWGLDPDFGTTGGTVTWGFVTDGTGMEPTFEIDPFGFPGTTGVQGTSNIGSLRGAIDGVHGVGAFDAAIQSAFDTWSSLADITFQKVADTSDTVMAAGSTSPNIRISAFVPEVGHSFNNVGAVGYGPPGASVTTDPVAGDIIFNLNATFDIVAGVEDTTPMPAFTNDLEGLMLHELGHAAFGMGHPGWDGEDPDQRVMYVGDFGNPSAPFCCGTINRQPAADDIAAALYVYG